VAKRLLEIGSGIGLAGLVAGSLCASSVLSDYMPAIVANLQHNVQLNFPAASTTTTIPTSEHPSSPPSTVAGITLDWSVVDGAFDAADGRIPWNPATDVDARFDVIIGSDVVYRKEDSDMIAQVVRVLLRRDGTHAIVGPVVTSFKSPSRIDRVVGSSGVCYLTSAPPRSRFGVTTIQPALEGTQPAHAWHVNGPGLHTAPLVFTLY
jgi:hypothetical protein